MYARNRIISTASHRQRFSSKSSASISFSPTIWALLVQSLAELTASTLKFERLFGRKPKDEVKPDVSQTRAPANRNLSRISTSDQMLREWLSDPSRTPNWHSESERDSPGWVRQRPALLIGLGYAGENVIAEVANYLRGRCGPHWSTNLPHIRLLHINVSQDERNLPGQISAGKGFPSLTLGLDSEKRQRISWHKGLQWFDRTLLGRPGRGMGRLALFADLAEGKAQSRVWSVLNSSIGDLKDISVYILADTFSDETSGIIADIAHLLRISRPNQIGRIALCLALQNAQWSDNLSQQKRSERTFATLREIQRLQLKTNVKWSYAPGLGQRELDSSSEGPLFDEILFFDGLGEENFDISKWSVEDALLPSMAGCMIALLDKETSSWYYQVWANQASVPVRRGSVPQEVVIGSMGSYALRLPVEEMRSLLESRLLHMLLFDREKGFIRWEELDEQGQPRSRGSFQRVAVGPNDVQSFLEATALLMEAAQRLQRDDIRRYLSAYLEQQLNGLQQGNLRWAYDLVGELKKLFMTTPWQMELSKFERSISDWIEAVVGQTAQDQNNIDPWASFLGGGGQPQRTATQSAQLGPLYLAWNAEWKENRKIMDRTVRMHAHRVLWQLGDESTLFNAQILPQNPLPRIRERLWWWWEKQGDTPKLLLLVLPNQLDVADVQLPHMHVRDILLQTPLTAAHAVSNAPQLLAALEELVKGFSRPLIQQRLAGYLRKNIQEYASDLQSKSTPLCRRRTLSSEQWPIAVDAFRYFTGDTDCIELIAGELASPTGVKPGAEQERSGREDYHFHPIPTSDSTECRLMHVKHVLPIHATDVFTLARSSYSTDTPKHDLHLWQEEQVASIWEEHGRKKVSPRLRNRKIGEGGSGISFSPRFVELLGQNEQEIRLFGQALVYGILSIHPETYQIFTQDESLKALQELSIFEAAKTFLDLLRRDSGLSDKVKKAIEEQRPADYVEKVKLLDKLTDQFVQPCSEQEDLAAQDLALFLGAMVAFEQ